MTALEHETRRHEAQRNIEDALYSRGDLDESLLEDISTVLHIPIKNIRRHVTRSGKRVRARHILEVTGINGEAAQVELTARQMMSPRLICTKMLSQVGRASRIDIHRDDWNKTLQVLARLALQNQTEKNQ